jgi:hypothetical protein
MVEQSIQQHNQISSIGAIRLGFYLVLFSGVTTLTATMVYLVQLLQPLNRYPHLGTLTSLSLSGELSGITTLADNFVEQLIRSTTKYHIPWDFYLTLEGAFIWCY